MAHRCAQPCPGGTARPAGGSLEIADGPPCRRHTRCDDSTSGSRLLAAIVGSAVATIDGSIVNVALPAIEEDLGGGLSAQQWVSNAYLLTLGR